MGQDHDAYVDEEVAAMVGEDGGLDSPTDFDEYVDEDGGLDSPTDFDEYEMNPDDCAPDGQPDEAQEWHDFDPDC